MSYSDSGWVKNCTNKKSTVDFVFILNRGPISYTSKKQAVIALSSTEAAYMALSLAVHKGIWLQLFMTELGLLLPN